MPRLPLQLAGECYEKELDSGFVMIMNRSLGCAGGIEEQESLRGGYLTLVLTRLLLIFLDVSMELGYLGTIYQLENLFRIVDLCFLNS